MTNGNPNYSGAFFSTLDQNAAISAGGGNLKNSELRFSANNSNSIYTDNGKVYPLSLALNYIIKA